MAIDLDEVCPSVIVVIDKTAAPGYVSVVDSNPGSKGDIAEGSIAVVVVQVAGVICEVGLEYIEPSVTVVVRHGDPHPSLLMPVVTVSAAGHDSDIRERTVVVVLEQDARFGVHGDINVRPPIVVKIIGDGGDGVSWARLENS